MQEKILHIKDIDVLVIRKPIKNLHLNVLPTEGKVRVSVPFSVSDQVVKSFVIKKYNWIKKHIKAFQEQERQTFREYVSGESHYLRGQRYIMRIEKATRLKIEIKNKKYIYFYVPETYNFTQRKNYYENWLRKELKKDLVILVPKWEKIIGVKANEIKVKKMKTKWGSCNPLDKRIWINLELIKKPTYLLEYIIVHELVHLLEEKHNERFIAYMDKFMPKWQTYRRQLNEFIL